MSVAAAVAVAVAVLVATARAASPDARVLRDVTTSSGTTAADAGAHFTLPVPPGTTSVVILLAWERSDGEPAKAMRAHRSDRHAARLARSDVPRVRLSLRPGAAPDAAHAVWAGDLRTPAVRLTYAYPPVSARGISRLRGRGSRRQARPPRAPATRSPAACTPCWKDPWAGAHSSPAAPGRRRRRSSGRSRPRRCAAPRPSRPARPAPCPCCPPQPRSSSWRPAGATLPAPTTPSRPPACRPHRTAQTQHTSCSRPAHSARRHRRRRSRTSTPPPPPPSPTPRRPPTRTRPSWRPSPCPRAPSAGA